MATNALMAVEFWRAIQHGNEHLAQEIGRSMDILPVASTSFAFADVESPPGSAAQLAIAAPAATEGTSTLLSPRNVEPSTPDR